MKYTLSLLFILLIVSSGCTSPANENTNGTVIIPNLLAAQLEAHGSLEKWRSFHSLHFDLNRQGVEEHHMVDLQSRRIRISSENYKIGNDGKDVWITPALSALKYPFGPRFYHNIYFYRLGVPFVFADEGIHHTQREDMTIQGNTFSVIEISYDAGVGDSSDDSYLLYFDKKTNLLSIVLYTITYGTGGGSQYRAYVYPEWREVQGMLLPVRGVPYEWDIKNQTLGVAQENRSVDYSNIRFSTEPLDPGVFVKPDNAEVAPKI